MTAGATVYGPIELPDTAWQRPEIRQALRARDMGAVLRFVQQYGGVSQARIGAATDMQQGRVNEIINGKRDVSRLDVYERIADGIGMPDDARHLVGLAGARETRREGAAFDLAVWPEVVRVHSAQAAAAEEIREGARQAAEVDVLAVRGLGLLALNDSLLRDALARPADERRPRLRVALLHPESAAVAVRATEIGETPESLAAGIQLTEARLRDLSDCCDIEVYRYRAVPTWRVIRLDKVLYVGAFDAGWEGHESATYKLIETPRGPLYRGYRRQFDTLIADAERSV